MYFTSKVRTFLKNEDVWSISQEFKGLFEGPG